MVGRGRVRMVEVAGRGVIVVGGLVAAGFRGIERIAEIEHMAFPEGLGIGRAGIVGVC